MPRSEKWRWPADRGDHWGGVEEEADAEEEEEEEEACLSFSSPLLPLPTVILLLFHETGTYRVSLGSNGAKLIHCSRDLISDLDGIFCKL